MMLLREKLIRLLIKQNCGSGAILEDLEPAWQVEYLKYADEIVELFTSAIKGLDFKV